MIAFTAASVYSVGELCAMIGCNSAFVRVPTDWLQGPWMPAEAYSHPGRAHPPGFRVDVLA